MGHILTSSDEHPIFQSTLVQRYWPCLADSVLKLLVGCRLTGQGQGKPKKRMVGGREEAAALLDSESEMSSEDELGNPSAMQPNRAPQ